MRIHARLEQKRKGSKTEDIEKERAKERTDRAKEWERLRGASERERERERERKKQETYEERKTEGKEWREREKEI